MFGRFRFRGTTRITPETISHGVGLLVLGSRTKSGGAESRYLSVADYLESQSKIRFVRLISQEIHDQAVEKGINLNSFVIIKSGGIPSHLARELKYVRWLQFALRLLVNLRRLTLSHVHLVAWGGPVVFLWAFFSSLLPKFSYSIYSHTVIAELHKSRIVRWLSKFAIRRAQSVECLTPDIYDAISQVVAPNQRSKLYLAPGTFFDGSRNVMLRQERDIDAIFVSRFVSSKGLRHLATIGAELQKRGLKMVAVGEGPENLPTEVENFGWLSNPRAVMCRSKVFLSLQEVSNFPSQSLLEAMAQGCAIIATDVGDTRELLDDTCAILVEPNAEHILEALLQLLSDSARLAELSNAAIGRVRNVSDPKQYADHFMDVLGSESPQNQV